MPKEQEFLGLTLRETKQTITERIALRQKLAEERKKVEEERITLTLDKLSDNSLKIIRLNQRLEDIDTDITQVDTDITQVREWYNLGVTESLYHESKRLNTLTTVLIGLTAILGILTIIDILSRVITHV